MVFDEYLRRWGLTPDGDPIVTRCSRLLPVRRGPEPLMLKIAGEDEERLGPLLLVWWGGDGAARVLEHEGDALLLERATGTGSLDAMVAAGDDDAATGILCGAVARLHAPRGTPPPDLIPLTRWFRDLGPAAERFDGILRLSDVVARELLAEPRDVVPLHGDIHHGNVLDFGDRGWLAIDPKRLEGDRGFDYANIFENPHESGVPTRPECFQRRLAIVTEAAGIERERMLRWIVAWCGLSAGWTMLDGDDDWVEETLEVARMAAAELDLA